MRRKKVRVQYKKERVILSDVLPYELPLTFSNRYFFEFLLSNGIELRDEKAYWKKDDGALDAIVRLMCGVHVNTPIVTGTVIANGKPVSENSFASKADFRSIPFCFKIRYGADELRDLTICHPRNQIQVIEFYDKFKELILAHSAVSPFSIRRPARVSRYFFYKDTLHASSVSDEAVGVEEWGKEYEHLRSFFVYRDYSHIFRFYESHRFHRCEKKYNKLLKLDVSKCFDSIYTHSLPWALYGKAAVKENLPESGKTFGGRFDKLMRAMNHGETNGIIIGPEFSRVFAELILQAVDRSLLLELRKEHDCHHKTQYEIFRFVDDYFVFYNEDKVKDLLVTILQVKLKEFKLYLNKGKALIYDKPIITNISMAKQRIASLLNEILTSELRDVSQTMGAVDPVQRTMRKSWHLKIDPNKLITRFKTILKEFEVEYKDTLNYTLAILESRCSKILKEYRLYADAEASERELGQALADICEFTFFIYSVSPRANTTIRLCRILFLLTSFLKGKPVNPDVKHSVFKAIFDNIHLILTKNAAEKHTPVETLYLLIALSELGKNYWLEIDNLRSYFNINNSFKFNAPPNYISIVVLLFYIRNRKEYDRLRTSIEGIILDKFLQKPTTFRKDSELTLLLFDTLSCPYIRLGVKQEILKIYGVVDNSLRLAVINKQQYWFTKWTAFDLGKALDEKQSREVY